MKDPESKRLEPLAGLPDDELLIHEIYASIQGESTWAGQPCVFVRTTGCNLRCRWCDTGHAFTQGERMTIDAVLAAARAPGLELVEVTGGEPLLQPAVLPLMTRLLDHGHSVLLETGGSLDISAVDARVVRIVDFKAPASGEDAQNRFEIIEDLRPHDEVKLVLADRADYEWARTLVRAHDLADRCTVLLGAVWGSLETAQLCDWVLEDRLPVRVQVQLHKLLWGPTTRGV